MSTIPEFQKHSALENSNPEQVLTSHLLTMEIPDSGFCFPLRNLENNIVKLTPFSATTHAPEFFKATQPYPEMYKYTHAGPFETLQEFLTFFLEPIQKAPDQICFAIIDKRTPRSATDPDGQLVGSVSCNRASVEQKTVTIGHTVVFPGSQRDHIGARAVGLLVRHFLASPADGGLGLWRVQALVATGNRASLRGYARYGFRQEGTHRWHRLLHDGVKRGKFGNRIPMAEYADRGDIGCDAITLAMCWDDWLDGGRERVEQLIGAVSKSPRVQSRL